MWYTIISRNKYDVGITKEKYTIRLSNSEPIKSYVPHCTLAMIEAINDELDKMLKADFIEKSISPFSAFMVCTWKPDGRLQVTIDFRMINKNVINNAYPMHCIDDQIEA